jgi:hypothetical protein
MHTVAMKRIVIIGDKDVEYRLAPAGSPAVTPVVKGKRHPAKACGVRKHENRDCCYFRSCPQEF